MVDPLSHFSFLLFVVDSRSAMSEEGDSMRAELWVEMHEAATTRPHHHLPKTRRQV